MAVHKKNQPGNQDALCGKIIQPSLLEVETYYLSNNIDEITCVDCLRMLAKDAGKWGNRRRPSQKW